MSEDNPHGFLDFLFGSAPLKKAAGQAKPSPQGQQDTSYIKKKIDEYMAQKKAKEDAAKPAPKAAMDELSKPSVKKPAVKPMMDAGQQQYADK